MFRSLLTIIRLLVVTEYSNSTICAFVQDTIIYNSVIQIQTIVLYVRNWKLKVKNIVEIFKNALCNSQCTVWRSGKDWHRFQQQFAVVNSWNNPKPVVWYSLTQVNHCVWEAKSAAGNWHMQICHYLARSIFDLFVFRVGEMLQKWRRLWSCTASWWAFYLCSAGLVLNSPDRYLLGSHISITAQILTAEHFTHINQE